VEERKRYLDISQKTTNKTVSNQTAYRYKYKNIKIKKYKKGIAFMSGKIREASEKDIEIIVEYNYNLAKETEHIELDRNVVYKGVEKVIKDRSKGIYFLFEAEGRVVGQLLITKEWSDWRDGEFWWVQSVYVHKDYRKNNVFKALYHHVEDIVLKDEKLCGLRLYVEKDNVTAQNTYRSLGMEETYYKLYEMTKRKF
jgi:GNAT superfamily N-acetyltransferase